MCLVVITPLLDAADPARGKATFGNELKRNHKIQTQKKKKGFSYRQRTATKSIVWWNVCVQPQKGTAEVRASKSECKTRLNSIKTASVDRLKSLHDGYYWWRFRILHLRSGLNPSTVLFLRARNSSLWFSSGQTHHASSSRWITEHQFSPCARRQTATEGTEWLKSCRDLWHLKHDRLWSNWRKKKTNSHLFSKSGRSFVAQTISHKTPWRMRKIKNKFHIKWSIAAKQLSVFSFTKSNVKI